MVQSRQWGLFVLLSQSKCHRMFSAPNSTKNLQWMWVAITSYTIRALSPRCQFFNWKKTSIVNVSVIACTPWTCRCRPSFKLPNSDYKWGKLTVSWTFFATTLLSSQNFFWCRLWKHVALVPAKQPLHVSVTLTLRQSIHATTKWEMSRQVRKVVEGFSFLRKLVIHVIKSAWIKGTHGKQKLPSNFLSKEWRCFLAFSDGSCWDIIIIKQIHTFTRIILFEKRVQTRWCWWTCGFAWWCFLAFASTTVLCKVTANQLGTKSVSQKLPKKLFSEVFTGCSSWSRALFPRLQSGRMGDLHVVMRLS